LFKNVKDNNFSLNTFLVPDKLFHLMNESKDWEFVVLYIKEEYSQNKLPVSVCFCHINADQVYSPMLIGMDYEYLMEYGVYRQTLYQVIKRANDLHCKKGKFRHIGYHREEKSRRYALPQSRLLSGKR
jgi:hypothetical protein